jgi:hypothetical protein
MIGKYVIPVITTPSDLYFSAINQNYLTDIPDCNSDLNCINGVASGGIELCASGIADPSQLDACAFTNSFDCNGNIVNQDTATLANCVADPGLGCPPGSIGVECDFTGDCPVAIDCIFLGSGVTCSGEFVPCPVVE